MATAAAAAGVIVRQGRKFSSEKKSSIGGLAQKECQQQMQVAAACRETQ
jgi:hypothetical protein